MHSITGGRSSFVAHPPAFMSFISRNEAGFCLSRLGNDRTGKREVLKPVELVVKEPDYVPLL
jgi:hypothetical protein